MRIEILDKLEEKKYMIKQLCWESIRYSEDILTEYDSELASLFSKVASQLVENICFGEWQEKGWDVSGDLRNKIYGFYDVNIIPGDGSDECHRYCIAFANEKWKSKNGFCKVADSVITHWLECSGNKGTLIFTSAWDEKDFKDKFKIKFDAQAKHNSSIAVILVTSTGFSVQCLG